jgi:hypothetical protein
MLVDGYRGRHGAVRATGSPRSRPTTQLLPALHAEATKAQTQLQRFPQSKQLDALVGYRPDTGGRSHAPCWNDRRCP